MESNILKTMAFSILTSQTVFPAQSIPAQQEYCNDQQQDEITIVGFSKVFRTCQNRIID
jgi:hypothetical protein